jgi:hypothetical protein
MAILEWKRQAPLFEGQYHPARPARGTEHEDLR